MHFGMQFFPDIREDENIEEKLPEGDDEVDVTEIRQLQAVKTEKSLVPLDPKAAYIQEIRSYEGLSEEEERELAIQYSETGDVKAA